MRPRPSRPNPARRWFPVATAVALVFVGAFAPTSMARPAAPLAPSSATAAAAPAPDVEAQFVGRINSLRASKGLSQLKVSSQLTGVARNWTEKMVANGGISHNPNLANEIKGDWTKAGENVGVGYSVDALMQAFIKSPKHYENLVDPAWNYLGVGVTLGADGRIWTTHNFMALRESAPAPPAPTPTVTSPRVAAPAPGRSAVATPTAAAPTTTTTVAAAPTSSTTQVEISLERVGAMLVPLRSLEGV
ncbi:MAG: CAP domain-containing protein [Acidimicrobiales bacterium]